MGHLEADGLTQALPGGPERAIVTRLRCHQFGQRLGDDVEFLPRGLFGAATGILEQHHQQRREDTCDSMNSRLPFLEIRPQRQAGSQTTTRPVHPKKNGA
jgi:hypothetical protein